MHTVETVAAPTLMYLPNGGGGGKGIYYLATEIYPNRYNDAHRGDWQVKVFYASARTGSSSRSPTIRSKTGERACLFQHVFERTFYGYQCHLDHATEKWQMEVLVVPLTESAIETENQNSGFQRWGVLQ